jgi:hypothetical protein
VKRTLLVLTGLCLLGCSGLLGDDTAETPPPPPPEQPLAIGVDDVPPGPGELPSTSGWEQVRLQQIRLGLSAPTDWSVNDTPSEITATAPSGAVAHIVSSTTCGEQIEGKRGVGTPAFDEPGRFVFVTTAADGTPGPCGVVAGRTLGDHVWCATVDEKATPAMTTPECMVVAAMVQTIQEPPGKGGGHGGKKGNKRPQ